MFAVPKVGDPELVEHVGADSVGAEGHRVGEPGGSGVADGVVHVGPRVVYNGARQAVVVVEVHAVHHQPVVGCEVTQSVSGVGVDRALGHVDVDADAVVGGHAGSRLERLVAAGERGMHAHPAPPARGEEAGVLLEAAPRPVGAVPVGDAVAAVDPHPHLGTRIGDDRERALDRLGRLMVVDDRRATALQGLEGAEHRRPADRLGVERPVEAPPHKFEDLPEVPGCGRRRRHAACQRRVEVVVGADQPRGRRRVGVVGHRPSQSAQCSSCPGAAIGNSVRHSPSCAWRAAATAPAVGTRPISPTPLIP